MWRKKITKSQTYMSWHAGMRRSHMNVFVNMTVRVCACWACVYVCECEEECKENWTASMLLLLFGIDDEVEEEAKHKAKQSKAKTEWQREINERLVSMVKCRFLIFAYVFFFCFCFFHHCHYFCVYFGYVSVWEYMWFGWFPRLSGIHFSLCCAPWLNRLNRTERAFLSAHITFKRFPINFFGSVSLTIHSVPYLDRLEKSKKRINYFSQWNWSHSSDMDFSVCAKLFVKNFVYLSIQL